MSFCDFTTPNSIMNKFVEYLNLNNIPFKTTLKGFPDMRLNQNKIQLKLFMEHTFNEIKNKRTNKLSRNSLNQVRKKLEFDDLENAPSLQTNIDTYNCVICMEDISTNICLLDCKHSFCVSCFAKHMRESGCCPLCRSNVTEKPKKMEKIPNDTLNQIIRGQLLSLYPERDNQTFPDYLDNCCKEYFPSFKREEEGRRLEFVQTIIKEVQEVGLDVGHQVAKWYNSSL